MTEAAQRQDSKKSLDLVHLRQLLGELVERKESSALLDVVFGVLLQAEKVIEGQAFEIQQLRKQLFGRRSEKLSPDQLSLFAQMLATVTAAPSDAETPSPSDVPATQPKKKKGKSPRPPITPTQSHEIRVPHEERDCPHCGGARCAMGHARSLVVEYTPPKIDVIEYLREKIVCRRCEGEIGVAPAPAERVIEGALPGPQLLAALTINKTVDGLPLNRTQKIFARSGLDIPIQTLNRWEGFSHQLLAPVVAQLRSCAGYFAHPDTPYRPLTAPPNVTPLSGSRDAVHQGPESRRQCPPHGHRKSPNPQGSAASSPDAVGSR